MQQFLERKIGGLTIRVDRTLCVGFGDCIEIAPDVLEFDEEGVARFIETVANIERDRLIQACDVCPVDALSVIDEAGNQLV